MKRKKKGKKFQKNSFEGFMEPGTMQYVLDSIFNKDPESESDEESGEEFDDEYDLSRNGKKRKRRRVSYESEPSIMESSRDDFYVEELELEVKRLKGLLTKSKKENIRLRGVVKQKDLQSQKQIGNQYSKIVKQIAEIKKFAKSVEDENNVLNDQNEVLKSQFKIQMKNYQNSREKMKILLEEKQGEVDEVLKIKEESDRGRRRLKEENSLLVAKYNNLESLFRKIKEEYNNLLEKKDRDGKLQIDGLNKTINSLEETVKLEKFKIFKEKEMHIKAAEEVFNKKIEGLLGEKRELLEKINMLENAIEKGKEREIQLAGRSERMNETLKQELKKRLDENKGKNSLLERIKQCKLEISEKNIESNDLKKRMNFLQLENEELLRKLNFMLEERGRNGKKRKKSKNDLSMTKKLTKQLKNLKKKRAGLLKKGSLIQTMLY